MSDNPSWSQAKTAYPVGSPVHGTVASKHPFGILLAVADAPGITVFVDIASYNVRDASGEPAPLPQVGDAVDGVVASHVDRDRQIRVRVGRPYWEEADL